MPVPNYSTCTRPPLGKSGYSGQILIKLRGYDNLSHKNARVTKLCHITTSTIQCQSRDKILLVTLWTKIMTL